MRARIGVGVAVLALISACLGPSDDDKKKAVDQALDRLATCLGNAKYIVDRDQLLKDAGPGVGSGSVRVTFHSKTGQDPVRLSIKPGDGTMEPLDSGDQRRLTAAGCR